MIDPRDELMVGIYPDIDGNPCIGFAVFEGDQDATILLSPANVKRLQDDLTAMLAEMVGS